MKSTKHKAAPDESDRAPVDKIVVTPMEDSDAEAFLQANWPDLFKPATPPAQPTTQAI